MVYTDKDEVTDMFYYMVYNSPLGKLYLTEEEGFITKISFSSEVIGGYVDKTTPLLENLSVQLDEYFLGKRRTFEVPFKLRGTEFMKKVWAALIKIPYGQTATYKDIAVQSGNAKACRAVGMANNKNPIAIVIPCHRVIGSNGKLVGYAGGLYVKEYLLNLEKGK